jgi:hypothetical protein
LLHRSSLHRHSPRLDFMQTGPPFSPGVYSTAAGAQILLNGSQISECSPFSGTRIIADINEVSVTLPNTVNNMSFQFDVLCLTLDERVEEFSGSIALNDQNTTANQGYYLYDQLGDTFGFGNDSYLTYLGNPSVLNLNKPIVSMVPTPDGGGYWDPAADGGEKDKA